MLGLQSALMDVLLQGPRFKPAGRPRRRASSTRSSPPARSWSRPRRRGSSPTRRRGARTRGTARATRCPAAPRRRPALAQFLPAFPALLRKQTKGADYPAQRAILSAAVEGAQVDFDTACRIESRYLTNLIVNQNSKNMIQAFFFDLQAINSGRCGPAGIEPLAGHQGRRPRRRDDGRRHRLLVRPRRHAGRAQGRRASRPPRRARPTPRSSTPRRSSAASSPRRSQASCSPASPDRRPRRPGRLRPGHRGRLRGPVPQAPGVRRGRAVRRRRRAAVLQHLDAADHRARRRASTGRPTSSGCTSSARRQDAAGRDHPRRGDLRRRARQGLRRRPADPQDADRRQRQPRLLHLAGHRHHGQRGPGDARRGRAPDVARAGRDAGRLPGRDRCSSPTSSTWS